MVEPVDDRPDVYAVDTELLDSPGPIAAHVVDAERPAVVDPGAATVTGPVPTRRRRVGARGTRSTAFSTRSTNWASRPMASRIRSRRTSTSTTPARPGRSPTPVRTRQCWSPRTARRTPRTRSDSTRRSRARSGPSPKSQRRTANPTPYPPSGARRWPTGTLSTSATAASKRSTRRDTRPTSTRCSRRTAPCSRARRRRVAGRPLYPTRPGPDFGPEEAVDTVERLRDRAPDAVLYGHFGAREGCDDADAVVSNLPSRWASSPAIAGDVRGVLRYLRTE